MYKLFSVKVQTKDPLDIWYLYNDEIDDTQVCFVLQVWIETYVYVYR